MQTLKKARLLTRQSDDTAPTSCAMLQMSMLDAGNRGETCIKSASFGPDAANLLRFLPLRSI